MHAGKTGIGMRAVASGDGQCASSVWQCLSQNILFEPLQLVGVYSSILLNHPSRHINHFSPKFGVLLLHGLIVNEGVSGRHLWGLVPQVSLHDMLRNPIVNHTGAHRVPKLMRLEVVWLTCRVTDFLLISQPIQCPYECLLLERLPIFIWKEQ